MNSMYYSTDVDGNLYGDDYFLEDGEIIIKGEGSSDGGLTYGFQVQIENSASGILLMSITPMSKATSVK